jgi:hypothetical protein
VVGVALPPVSVPIACPRCGAGHLHAALYVTADGPEDRFHVTGLDATGRAVVTDAGVGALRFDEAILTCCACDWSEDFAVEALGESGSSSPPSGD